MSVLKVKEVVSKTTGAVGTPDRDDLRVAQAQHITQL